MGCGASSGKYTGKGCETRVIEVTASPTHAPTQDHKVVEDTSNDLTAEPQFEGEEVATFGDESFVCRTRRGCCLRYQTILKCDHFPSSQNPKLPEKLADAPNFRKVDGCNVFGVGQVGIEGMSTVLRRLLQEEGVKKVAWFNMREEPIIYINGKPYCVKHRTKPFNNQEATGINTEIVERIEESELRNEILAEAQRNGGKVLLHGETKPAGSEVAAWGKAYCYWEKVTPESVVTVRSVANKLVSDGFPLEFHRIPITDEKNPQLKDFDQVVDYFGPADASVGLIFNCQLGRGRTTTGMALAVMSQGLITKTGMQQYPDPKHFAAVAQIQYQKDDDSFAAVATLLDFFEGARAAKADVDAALDRCAHMQHLRDAIVVKRGTKYEAAGVCYLERYIFLILFMAYSREQTVGISKGLRSPVTLEGGFEAWITNHKDRNHIYNLLDHMTLDAP